MEKRLIRMLGVALALGAVAGAMAPSAAEAKRKAPRVVVAKTAQAFKAADANADRQLDMPEWAAAGKPAENFARIDHNADGTVGFWESLAAVFASIMAKAGGR
jgi:hypothetical protein